MCSAKQYYHMKLLYCKGTVCLNSTYCLLQRCFQIGFAMLLIYRVLNDFVIILILYLVIRELLGILEIHC